MNVQKYHRLVLDTAEEALKLILDKFKDIDEKEKWILTTRTVTVVWYKFYHPLLKHVDDTLTEMNKECKDAIAETLENEEKNEMGDT